MHIFGNISSTIEEIVLNLKAKLVSFGTTDDSSACIANLESVPCLAIEIVKHLNHGGIAHHNYGTNWSVEYKRYHAC